MVEQVAPFYVVQSLKKHPILHVSEKRRRGNQLSGGKHLLRSGWVNSKSNSKTFDIARSWMQYKCLNCIH